MNQFLVLFIVLVAISTTKLTLPVSASYGELNNDRTIDQ